MVLERFVVQSTALSEMFVLPIGAALPISSEAICLSMFRCVAVWDSALWGCLETLKPCFPQPRSYDSVVTLRQANGTQRQSFGPLEGVGVKKFGMFPRNPANPKFFGGISRNNCWDISGAPTKLENRKFVFIHWPVKPKWLRQAGSYNFGHLLGDPHELRQSKRNGCKIKGTCDNEKGPAIPFTGPSIPLTGPFVALTGPLLISFDCLTRVFWRRGEDLQGVRLQYLPRQPTLEYMLETSLHNFARNSRKNTNMSRPLRTIASHEPLHELLRQKETIAATLLLDVLGQNLRAGSQNLGINKHLGADIHDPNARTSMT